MQGGFLICYLFNFNFLNCFLSGRSLYGNLYFTLFNGFYISGKKATITVVVSKKEVKAKKVKVKGPSKMKRKQTKKLTVSLVKAKSTDTISFSSSNPAIASVDADRKSVV